MSLSLVNYPLINVGFILPRGDGYDKVTQMKPPYQRRWQESIYA